MAGFFFCLASAEGVGLLFCPAAIQPHTSVYSGFYYVHARLYRHRNKTAHRDLQGLFLQFVPLSRRRYQTDTSSYNTVCDTLERAHAPGRPAPIPDTTATPDAVQLSTAAYYNKVYKSASLLWIHAIQCSRSQTMQARRCQLLPSANRWHPPPGGAVQQQGNGGRRGTLDGYRRISFRAFAR